MTFTTLGIRGEHNVALGTVDATLRGMIGWRHAFGDLTPESVHAVAGGDAFTIAGVPIAQDAAVIEANLDLKLTPEATFGLSYTGQIASNAQDHGFWASLAASIASNPGGHCTISRSVTRRCHCPFSGSIVSNSSRMH